MNIRPSESTKQELNHLEDARLTFYEDEERRLKLLLVYGLKRHSNKDTCRTNEALKSSTLHIEHINSHDKTIQTRTSLSVIIVSNSGNEFLTTSDI